MPDDIRSLTAALARDPKSLVYADLAEALRRRGQRQEALQVVLQGLTRHPMHADGHDCLARIYADLGDLERARLAWSKALEIAPDHMGSLRGVAFLLFRQGDLATAEVRLESGDVAAARQAAEAALALRPEEPRAHLILARVRLAERLCDDAVTECRHAIRLAPDLADAWRWCGFALAAAGRFHEARESWERWEQLADGAAAAEQRREVADAIVAAASLERLLGGERA